MQRSGRSGLEASLGKKLARPPSHSTRQMWWHAPGIPAAQKGLNRKIIIQANLGKSVRLYPEDN
jgi:hypothetical protein